MVFKGRQDGPYTYHHESFPDVLISDVQNLGVEDGARVIYCNTKYSIIQTMNSAVVCTINVTAFTKYIYMFPISLNADGGCNFLVPNFFEWTNEHIHGVWDS